MENTKMSERTWADPSALCSMSIGLLLLAQWGFFTGTTGSTTSLALLPWLLSAIPVIFICVFIQFRLGDVMGGTVNGFLGIILMAQGAVKGIIALQLLLNGTPAPASYTVDTALTDVVPFFLSFFVLLVAGFLASFGQSKFMGICVWFASIGFLFLGLADLGLNPLLGLAGGYCMLIIGICLFYNGIAALLNGVTGKVILPLGKPFGRK